MARPKRSTVDYFSHDCTRPMPLQIINSEYGSEGYAFYFKLRELLGNTDEHMYDASSALYKKQLSMATDVKEERAIELIDFLAELKEIDDKLWRKELIWWPSFVNLLEDVYSRRKNPLPTITNNIIYAKRLDDFYNGEDFDENGELVEGQLESSEVILTRY